MKPTESQREYVVTFADGTVREYVPPTIVVVKDGALKFHRAGDEVNATYYSPAAWRSLWDRPFNPNIE